jgi:hypothetical protein
VAVYILLSPKTIHAPTPNDEYRESSPDSAAQIVSLGAAEAIGGPVISKVASKTAGAVSRLAGRTGTRVAEEAAGGEFSAGVGKSASKEPKIPGEQRVKTPTRQQREAVFVQNRTKYGGELKCDICGNKMVRAQKSQEGVSPKPNEATVDHIDPRSRGGTNDPRNLRGACRKCNRDKSDYD